MGLAEEVREVLAGSSLFGQEANDYAPLDAVVRKYKTLRGTSAEDELSRGVAACLGDADPSVRGQAVLFFEEFPQAAGGEELLKVKRELYAGVPNPWMAGNDLEWRLLHAVGARLSTLREPAALALARTAALDGRAQPIIAALASVDPDWVAAHAEEIVKKSPDAAAQMLSNLQGRGHDIAALGEKIAPLADGSFRDLIEESIDDPEVKRRILSAIK